MSSQKKTNILLVEDEPLIAIMEKEQLEKKGYCVYQVNTGEKAIQTIQDNDLPIDLVLMDIDLGEGIDGTKAAQEILNIKDIPVVFLSAHTEPKIVGKTEKITSYGYVVKNTGITVLDASIKMAIKLFFEKVKNKEAKIALQKSEEKFRSFIENANDIIYQVNPDGIFTYVSPNWVEILGYQLDEVIGKGVADFVHQDDIHLCLDFLNLVLSTGEKQSGVEYRVRHKNGSWKWHVSNGSPLKDENGNIFSYMGIARDITEKKQNEQAARELNQRFQTIIKNLPNGAVFLFDKDMKYIHVEGSALKEVGLEPEMMIGKTVTEVFPPEISKVAYKNQQRLFEGETCFFELEFSGNIYANWGQGIVNHNNEIKEGIIYSFDISELKKTQARLQNTLDRFWGLVNHLRSGVFYINTSGKILEVNDAMLGILGSPSAEATKEIDIFSFKPLIENGYSGKLKECIRTGETIHGAAEYSSKWGKKSFVEYYFVPIKENGKVIGVLSNNDDITERKHAEQEIQKQLTEKEVLLLEVHHRVKNNIANIESLLCLQADSTESAEAKAALMDSIAQVQSMRILYENLLISKQHKLIPIDSYIENLVDSIKAVIASDKEISISKDIEQFTITSNQAIVIGIIVNELLSNVFKHAFKGCKEGKISISIKKTAKIVTIIIHDNGADFIEAKEKPRSSGFGITIVEMLVEQLNGKYSIENKNGTKSTITFVV